jgi:glycosyltransferase involved in cell wall biosynthesis/tetratricopeptide (TPR) repeat protein
VAFCADTRFYDRRKIKWKGIIHETMQHQGELKMTRITKDVAYLEHFQNTETDRTKYLAGLAWACYEEPLNDRNSHYFARELMYRGKYRSAIKEFERHVSMGAWLDERGQSVVYIGCCYEALGENDKALEYWHRANDLMGNRREPLIHLAQYWKRHNSPLRVAAYAAAALQIPNNGFYANRVANYTYEPHELMYWAKGWLGDIPAARQHLMKCLEYHPTEKRFIRDMTYYFSQEEIDKASGKEPYPVVPASADIRRRIVPDGLKALNVGVGPGDSWLASQLPFMKFKQLDHIDINQEWLDKAKSVKWAAETVNYINRDIREYDKVDDYDLILFFDVLEHLPKEDSLRLLRSKPRKIVFIPLESKLGMNWGDDHVSLWAEREFKDLGFVTEFLPDFHRCKSGELVGALWATTIPLVSILMPAYNAEPFIAKAIESCQAQTLKDWELIIVDDGSTDKTLEIARRYAGKDRRVRVFAHDANKTYPIAFNSCLGYASGKYISRLDADDWDDPTRLEKSVARLGATPVCDCVSCGMYCGEEGNVMEMTTEKEGMVPWKYMDFNWYGKGGAPANATIVAKREIYEKVGGFGTWSQYGMDSEWDVRANLAGARWAYIPEPLYYYRRHSGQTVSQRPFTWYMEQQKGFLDLAKEHWDDPFSPIRHIEVMVTGKCNKSCPLCSQATFNKNHVGYQASLGNIKKICQRSLDIGAGYECISFSGGEPLLWDNLEEACKIVRDSGAFKKIRINSNGVNKKRMMSVLDGGLVDTVYANTYNADHKSLKVLVDKYPEKYIFSNIPHKPLPDVPLAGVLPANCHCNKPSIIGDNVYPCGNFYEHITRLRKNMYDYREHYCSLNDDWIGFFRKVDKFNMDICSYCLANGKVWDKIPAQTRAVE